MHFILWCVLCMKKSRIIKIFGCVPYNLVRLIVWKIQTVTFMRGTFMRYRLGSWTFMHQRLKTIFFSKKRFFSKKKIFFVSNNLKTKQFLKFFFEKHIFTFKNFFLKLKLFPKKKVFSNKKILL